MTCFIYLYLFLCCIVFLCVVMFVIFHVFNYVLYFVFIFFYLFVVHLRWHEQMGSCHLPSSLALSRYHNERPRRTPSRDPCSPSRHSRSSSRNGHKWMDREDSVRFPRFRFWQFQCGSGFNSALGAKRRSNRPPVALSSEIVSAIAVAWIKAI